VAVLPEPDPSPTPAAEERPQLVFFHSPQSGRCRRVEGFIAQVLQRRGNHDAFDIVRVSVDRHPELAARFSIERLPTLCVVEGRKLRRRIVAPSGCREIEQDLEPWLR
jgi:thioredoxin-like negative regulator of GroEL